MDLEERVRRLEAEQQRLRARVAELEQPRWNVAPAPASVAPERPSPEPRPAEAPPQRLDAAGLEQRIGARWLAYAGIVVFVIGAVFFLRLAIDQGWIGPLARVVLGLVVGAAMWGTGAWLDRRMPERVYGQVLAGGGALVLYFTLFAAHFFPTLRAVTGLGLEPAAVLLGLVALGLAAHAALRRAEALAYAAMVLVGITTVAAGDWSGFSVAYLVTMVAVLLAVAAWRAWPFVQAGALGAFAVLLLAHMNGVSDAAAVAGATALLAVHVAGGFWPGRLPRHMPDLVQALAFLLAWLVMAVALDTPYDGGATLLLAVAAFALMAVSLVREAPGWGWGLAGAALLFIWAPIQFDGPLVALVWALWCAGAGAATMRWPRIAIGAPWLAGGIVLWSRLQNEELRLVDDGLIAFAWSLLGVLAAAALMTPAWAARTNAPWPRVRFIAGSAIGLWILLATAAAVLDGPLVSIAWAGIAVAVLGAGAAMKRRDVRLTGIATFVPVLGRVIVVDLADVDPVLRVLSYLAVGALLLAVSFLYARQMKRALPRP